MITLKDYQVRVLDSLREFFRDSSKDGHPEHAYQRVQIRNSRKPTPYFPVNAPGLSSGMPYICLRVPTGGGKTLLACYASGLAKDELLHTDRAVVLWLVPSNTILDQTANALRDARHPYRRALDLSCGPVEVMTIEEALRLSRATVEGQTVVIVATIQSFRVEDTTGRKVYDQNTAFSEHLLNVPANRLQELLPGPDGKPRPSLVNMLRLRRPIVIVDEAHNARTSLSFSTLGQVLPSCIIEFTATPDRTETPSNVLHHVSASELKAADMVKLPLRVITRHSSQQDQLIGEAVSLRNDLQKLAETEAQATGEYLRPILLFQAEKVEACEPLRSRLISDFGISKDEIKISVGTLDELKGVDNIGTPKSPIRYIITVKKLTEGWDCPFAYVLCILRESRSANAIEQMVGRILRLPNAKSKQHPDLNCGYVFSISTSVGEVLAELRDALVSNGFTTAEAERIIIPVQGTLPLGAHPKTLTLPTTELSAAKSEAGVIALAGKVHIDVAKGEITVLVPLDAAETETLSNCVTTPEAKEKVRKAVALVREAEIAFGGTGKPRQPSPYEKGQAFAVPLLCIPENGHLFEFEVTFLLEHPWRLSEKDAALSTQYNPTVRPLGQMGKVDIGAKGEVETGFIQEVSGEDFITTLHQQTLAIASSSDWSIEELLKWLDHHIDHQDIPYGESGAFLGKVVRGLMAKFDMPNPNMLVLDRFRLKDEIEARINEHRENERKAAFQTFLLPNSVLSVTEEKTLDFRAMGYEPSYWYEGAFHFKKHYFGTRPGELVDKTSAGGLTEEFKCAQYLDSMPEVKYWVRNLVRKQTSFRLQTSKDWFYPDFVCQLIDGRILVVEYKGKHLYAEADEKRAVGAVWESRSKGKCLFVMPTDEVFQVIRSKTNSA